MGHLLRHLQHSHVIVRVNAVHTLGDLGMDRRDILMGILPLLIDTQVRLALTPCHAAVMNVGTVHCVAVLGVGVHTSWECGKYLVYTSWECK